ncbi:hypothetical protein DPMN_145468 [Dreissena polymorpha]|uniref:Uncharacterized protein n=1 Tax=Dreissena polymorpha TaxID=45954 RepID=A0A9D4F428_DREPO|nr:hypothetical protein DPMN_145468 [Dreissena polymorpha]
MEYGAYSCQRACVRSYGVVVFHVSRYLDVSLHVGIPKHGDTVRTCKVNGIKLMTFHCMTCSLFKGKACARGICAEL